MGVKRIFLDAASEKAKHAWMSRSLGFSQVTEDQYKVLAMQYTFVENTGIKARCLKVVPARAALLEQVSSQTSHLLCSHA